MPIKKTPLPDMRFLIKSTGCEIQLIEVKRRKNGDHGELLARPIYKFKYTNREPDPESQGPKHLPFTTYIEEIDRAVKLQVWIKL